MKMKNKSKKNQNIRKDIFWNTLGSGINAFNSLFFLIVVTRINGIDDAGIFTLAFSTANFFNIIGVYSGRVYQVTDTSSITDNDYFFHKILTCLSMLFISFMFIKIKHYSLWKSSIVLVLCLLKTFEAFSEVAYAFFQKEYALYKVGISLTLKNLIGFIVFLLTDSLTRNVLASSVMLVITYILIVFFYDCRNICLKKFNLQKVNKEHILAIFKKGFFAFCLSFLSMYILNIPRYVIDANMEDSFSTIFGILIMPASVVVLIAQFILHPFLMNLKTALEVDIKKFTITIIKMVALVFLFGVLSTIASYMFGIPLLELIYKLDLKEYKSSLVIVMCGATLYGSVAMLSNILISMRVIFRQTIVDVIGVVISLILSNYFTIKDGVNGACLAYCITMLALFILFVLLTITSILKQKREVNNNA